LIFPCADGKFTALIQQQNRVLAQQSLEKLSNHLSPLEKQRVFAQLDPKHFDPMAVAAAAANLQIQGLMQSQAVAAAVAANQPPTATATSAAGGSAAGPQAHHGHHPLPPPSQSPHSSSSSSSHSSLDQITHKNVADSLR